MPPSSNKKEGGVLRIWPYKYEDLGLEPMLPQKKWSVIGYTFNLNTAKVETGRFLDVQPSVISELQRVTEKPCLKK